MKFLCLLLLTYACACSHTETFLPAPEQTGPWLVVEVAEKEPGFLWKVTHPEDADDWNKAQKAAAWLGPGH